MFDYLIRRASILDGSGASASCGDIAIKDGRIAAIGNVDGEATRIINGADLVAAPGFIDFHSHTDSALFVGPKSESKITQGITLELCGNCGFSGMSGFDEPSRKAFDDWREENGMQEDWSSLDDMLSAMENRRIGINFATLVGHANIRTAVVGLADREASPKELDEMKILAAQAMEQGAFGISTGLIYPPSSYGNTAEIVELAKAVAQYGGIYASHVRDECGGLVDAVEEALQIGRLSGASVQISHHKVCGHENWGKVKMTLAMIRECRDIGMDVTIDQYPYTAGISYLKVVLPGWAHDGGDEALLGRIETMKDELLLELGNIPENAWAHVVIGNLLTEANRQFEGMSVLEISRAREMSPGETILAILSEENLGASAAFFDQCEDDVKVVMRSDFAMFGTDTTARSTAGPLSMGAFHPRAFGAFPRVLGKYVREEKVISLPKAIRKMTSLPAKKLGLTDRGLLSEGYWADIVLFDPDSVIDMATYEDPRKRAKGIEYVFVNGELAVDQGEMTGKLAGKVLRKKN